MEIFGKLLDYICLVKKWQIDINTLAGCNWYIYEVLLYAFGLYTIIGVGVEGHLRIIILF